MSSNNNYNYNYYDDDDENYTANEAPSVELFAEQNLATRKSPRGQPKTPVKPPPPRVSKHGDGNIKVLSRSSSQDIMPPDNATEKDSRKRSHPDDESDLHKKPKVDGEWNDGKPQKNEEENVNECGVGAIISQVNGFDKNEEENVNESGVGAIISQGNGFDPSNKTEQTVVTTFSQHSGSNALISYEIRNHIEQQVRATVAYHFEALQSKMNNVEDKMKQLLEGVRKSKKTKKGLEGLIRKVLSKKDQ